MKYREGAGVWEVIQKLGDDHYAKSPECPDISKLRLPQNGVLCCGDQKDSQ